MANEMVTYDLAAVLGNIQADIKQIQATQTTILVNQTKLEGKIDALETKFDGEISTIKTGQDGLAKRLDNIEMLIRIIIDGATVAFVGGIFTLVFTQLKTTLQIL